MCWQSGDYTPVTVVDWDAAQTTVQFQMAGMSCLRHFATETGLPLQEDGTPEQQPAVWLEFTAVV